MKGVKYEFINGRTRNNRLYHIWQGIKLRCLNSKRHEYKNYGARGITICDEWLNKETGFINFYNWAMANGYKEDLTIDRIDVNGNYCPENCRWATLLQQNRNKRNNKKVFYNGKTYNSIAELAEYLNTTVSFIRGRLKFNIPIDRYGKGILYNNILYKNKKELAKKYNISVGALDYRLKNNIPLDMPKIIGNKKCKGREGKGYFYKKQFYKTLEEIALHFNLNAPVVKYRLKHNIPLEIPLKQIRRHSC